MLPLGGIPKSMYKRILTPGCVLNSVKRGWCGRGTGLESIDGVYSLRPFVLVPVGFVR